LLLMCLQAMLVVGLVFSRDTVMTAGLLYVISVPGGGLGYLVSTLQSSTAARTISAAVNLTSTYLVLRMILQNTHNYISLIITYDTPHGGTMEHGTQSC